MKLILLAEDDPERAAEIQVCMPVGARCIWAKSAGAAIGVLKRDKLVGVMLDHDLDSDPQASALDGRKVARVVCETQSRSTCSVFVHSQNRIGGAAMVSYLQQAGFRVERCAWCDEAIPVIKEWLDSVSADA